ncbi:Poly(3-hydroxybutyrate) synthase subunit (fragment) [Syntrophobacter sp. SbD1]
MCTTTVKDQLLSDYHGGGIPFQLIDQFRRWQGRAFDLLGAAPIVTPGRILLRKTGITLKGYTSNNGPVLLLVPAPVKRSYIWNLAPRNSVVRRCLSYGLQVYLIQWEHPGKDGCELGLVEYAHQIILDCLNVVATETGQSRVFLAGHSLGGTFAAIFAALHPECLQGLILLGAPINFETDSSAFGPLVANAPEARVLTAILGCVPGSFLNLICALASPTTFAAACWLDWLNSINNVESMQTHIRARPNAANLSMLLKSMSI